MHIPATQVLFVHGAVVDQKPDEVQIDRREGLSQTVSPGIQSAAQAPETQEPGHSVPLVQAPDALHVCGVAPLHRVAPGVHASVVQAPFTQGP